MVNLLLLLKSAMGLRMLLKIKFMTWWVSLSLYPPYRSLLLLLKNVKRKGLLSIQKDVGWVERKQNPPFTYRYYSLSLLLFFLSFNVNAVYDQLAIDVIPNNDEICIESDNTGNDKTYVASYDNKLKGIPDHFPKPDNYESCFALASDDIYAGVGKDVDDIVNRKNYARIFDATPISIPIQKTAKKAWTIMVYMLGSDLESRGKAASKDIMEMLAGTGNSAKSLNVIVTTGSSERLGWRTLKRIYIQNGQRYVLDDLGKQKMSNPQTLSGFVNWATEEFPAQHYALILWSHGGGSSGFGDQKDHMTLRDLQQAYRSIEGKLDLVAYDACFMGAIEVAEVTKIVANTMVASVEIIPEDGFDYKYLMQQLIINPNLELGELIKAGYIESSKDDKGRITISVTDLTQLDSFDDQLQVFAEAFKQLMESQGLGEYQGLSYGLINSPGYPLVETGKLDNFGTGNIRIDLYSFIKNIGEKLSLDVEPLLSHMTEMVKYEGNQEGGHFSINIGSEDSYLPLLPQSYRDIRDGLIAYDERKNRDTYIPRSKNTCYKGNICADAQWLELPADEILGIEAYFGQLSVNNREDIYLIDKYFYQPQEENLPVYGKDACQYQICVDENRCQNITLTKQNEQLLANIKLNGSEAILSFCQNDERWSSCGVTSQIVGGWGRYDSLYPKDKIVAISLHRQNQQLQSQLEDELIVSDNKSIYLKTSCDQKKAMISVGYYSSNQKLKFERLCDKGDCVCEEDSYDPSCQVLNTKAGVYLKK